MFNKLSLSVSSMSIISAYNEAWEKGDVEALANLLHDDFTFNPHVGGVTMGKSDIMGFAGMGAAKSETGVNSGGRG